jgi:hypothetical protein
MQSHTEQPSSWLKGFFKVHIFHYEMTKIQESQGSLVSTSCSLFLLLQEVASYYTMG